MLDYGPLWATMRERHVTQYRLIQEGIDRHTLDNLRKNKSITMYTLEQLCNIIGCTPNDVVRFVDEKPQQGAREQAE